MNINLFSQKETYIHICKHTLRNSNIYGYRQKSIYTGVNIHILTQIPEIFYLIKFKKTD